MIAVAKKRIIEATTTPTTIPRKAPWLSPPDAEDETGPVRGSDAVQHGKGGRGRRSVLFPDINITATAAKLGVTKSHLAKVLAGQNKPGIDLMKKLAEVLGKDIAFVAALSDNWVSQSGTPKRKNK